MPGLTVSPIPTKPAERMAGDLWGGFAAMLVALPSSIAFGVAIYGQIGADFVAHGVRAGLLGAVSLGLISSLLGGAPRLISAPCAPAAAVLAALTGEMLGAHPGPDAPVRIIAFLTLVAVLSAALQLSYGFARGGRLIKYIPYPVVSGYLSAVGVIIFLGQLPKFLGLGAKATWQVAILHPGDWNHTALIVGAVTIAGVIVGPRLTRTIPATIIGLAAGLAAYFGLAATQPALLSTAGNPLVIGPLGGGPAALVSGFSGTWSALGALRWSDFGAILVPALTLSVLLSMDTLKTCVVVDALTRARHDSNRTLLAQGAGNLASSLLGGMPGAGTMGATLVNIESGGCTRFSGVAEGGFALLTAVLLGAAIAWVPVAALAGILVVVAVRMFDWGSLQLLRQRTTLLDFAVIGTVVVVAVAYNLIAAAGAGVTLAILLFIRDQVNGSVIRRKFPGTRAPSTQHRLPAEQAVLEQHGGEILVCELQGNLFFGTTDQLLAELDQQLGECRFLILDLRRVQSVDYTAAHLLERFERNLAERNGWLIFSRVPAHLPTGRNLRDYFDRLGVVNSKRHVKICETLDDAVMWAEDKIIAEQLPSRTGIAAALALEEFDLFEGLAGADALTPLRACLAERTCAAGEAVFKAGETGQELFLVRRGIVRVILPLREGGRHNLASFGRGSFFGEMSFLTGKTRSAEAIATEPTDLFVLDRERFDRILRDHPALGVTIFSRIARVLALRLRHTNAALRALYDA